MADAARAEEARQLQKTQALEAAVQKAEAAALEARNRASLEWQREQALKDEARALEAQMQQERQQVAQQVSAGAGEEVTYLKRKKQERERELEQLQQEQTRLKAVLHRHTGPREAQSNLRAEAGVSGTFAAFDNTVSHIVNQLFKSILVRRFFCVHLVVLYGWLFFLLWWMFGV